MADYTAAMLRVMLDDPTGHDEVPIRDPREVANDRELFDQLWASGLEGASATALVRRVDRWLSTLAE